jgi:hypothetical protein
MPIVGRLPHRLGIILPSRDRRGRRLPAATRRVIRAAVTDWFGRAFPGSTEDRMQMRPRLRGRWSSGIGVTVEEIEEILDLLHHRRFPRAETRPRAPGRVGRGGSQQEAVAILVDNGMELVVGKETS